jgi:catechol 2,3-dioxygenase-like lactoylglutathione lyase family enzyme
MKFICSLVIVENIARARELYENILGQKVIADFGENNLAFDGGLALYKRSLYQSLIGDSYTIAKQPNNFELYFEEDDLDVFENRILQLGFKFLHTIREEPWKQRVFRFYDYDQNIVVIAESMEQVSSRLYAENHSVEEIAQLTGMPIELVKQQIQTCQLAEGLSRN